MSLPATEDFAGGAGALGGSWSQARPTSGTVDKDGSGQGKCSAVNADVLAWWNADGFSADQYAQGQVFNIVAGTSTASAAVRCSGTTDATSNGYVFQAGDALYKVVNGTFTFIATDPVSSWTNGDTIRLEVTGTGAAMALKMFRNGGQVGTTQNDTALTSGAAGAHLFNNSTNRIDNWEGGNLGVAASAAAFSFGTRRAPGARGPFDRRGFLLRRQFDYTPSSAIAQSISAPSAVLRFLALAPVLTPGGATLSVPAAQVRVLAQAPTLAPGGRSIAAPSAVVRLLAQAPTLSAGAAALAAPSATIRFLAQAPALQAGAISLAAPSSVVRLLAQAPALSSGGQILAPSAAIRFLGQAPSFTAGAAITNPPPAVIRFLALAPTFTGGAQPPVTTSRRRKLTAALLLRAAFRRRHS